MPEEADQQSPFTRLAGATRFCTATAVRIYARWTTKFNSVSKSQCAKYPTCNYRAILTRFFKKLHLPNYPNYRIYNFRIDSVQSSYKSRIKKIGKLTGKSRIYRDTPEKIDQNK